MEKIDSERGDVSRSRFLLRLIEKAYEKKHGDAKVNHEIYCGMPLSREILKKINNGRSELGRKNEKNKQGSLDIRFPGLSSSGSRTPQQ
jgi:hypothetical protein